MNDPRDDEIVFRSLAAPGLEEDDLLVALHGLPVPGPFWGDGWPAPPRADAGPWCEESERRRRHEDLMRRWRRAEDSAG